MQSKLQTGDNSEVIDKKKLRFDGITLQYRQLTLSTKPDLKDPLCTAHKMFKESSPFKSTLLSFIRGASQARNAKLKQESERDIGGVNGSDSAASTPVATSIPIMCSTWPKAALYYCGGSGPQRADSLKTTVFHLRAVDAAKGIPLFVDERAYFGVPEFSARFVADFDYTLENRAPKKEHHIMVIAAVVGSIQSFYSTNKKDIRVLTTATNPTPVHNPSSSLNDQTPKHGIHIVTNVRVPNAEVYKKILEDVKYRLCQGDNVIKVFDKHQNSRSFNFVNDLTEGKMLAASVDDQICSGSSIHLRCIWTDKAIENNGQLQCANRTLFPYMFYYENAVWPTFGKLYGSNSQSSNQSCMLYMIMAFSIWSQKDDIIHPAWGNVGVSRSLGTGSGAGRSGNVPAAFNDKLALIMSKWGVHGDVKFPWKGVEAQDFVVVRSKRKGKRDREPFYSSYFIKVHMRKKGASTERKVLCPYKKGYHSNNRFFVIVDIANKMLQIGCYNEQCWTVMENNIIKNFTQEVKHFISSAVVKQILKPVVKKRPVPSNNTFIPSDDASAQESMKNMSANADGKIKKGGLLSSLIRKAKCEFPDQKSG